MRMTVKHVEAKLDIYNDITGKGDENEGYSKVLGSVRLYGDQCGYAIHQLANESGGIHNLSGSGLTLREAAAFLSGMITSFRTNRPPTIHPVYLAPECATCGEAIVSRVEKQSGKGTYVCTEGHVHTVNSTDIY